MSRSAGEILPSSSIVVRSQSTRPPQYDVPNTTTGNDVTFRVCASVSASNSSSSVPNPPGITTKPCAYFTNIVFRVKKYRKFMPTSTHSFRPFSKGSSMPSPTETPPASDAPLLAASITPGPPPVITAYPAPTSFRPHSSAAAYIGSSGLVRADPNTQIAAPSSASMPNPSMNSDWIRSTRHGSVCTQSDGPRLSSSRCSDVEACTWLRRIVTGPRCDCGGRSGWIDGSAISPG